MASGDTLYIFTPQSNEPPASAYATLDTRNAHVCLDFDGSTDEEAVFSGILPRQYAGGGLTVNILVGFTSATTGTSRWQAAFERTDLSGLDLDADSFPAFQSGTAAAPGTSGQLVNSAITFTAGAAMDSLAVGERFRLKIRRDADGTSGTDDIATDAEVFAIEVKET